MTMKCLNCEKEIGRKSKKYCSYTCYYANMDHHGINNSRYGAKLTGKTKKLISIGNTGKLIGRPSPLKGRIHTEEHNKKISENTSKALLMPGMKSKLQTMLGKHHTMGAKEKSRISNLGQKRTEDARKNMRLGYQNHASFKGKHHTLEAKQKLRKVAIDRLINHKGPYKDTKPELMVKGMLIDLGFIELHKGELSDIHGINFIHQYHMHITHDYVADFVFPELKIVIEEDGAHFHKDKRILQDNIRTKEMIDKGYAVLRVTDIDVLKNYDMIKDNIRRFVIGCEFDQIITKILPKSVVA